MKLSKADIKNLFGEHLFIIPDDQASPETVVETVEEPVATIERPVEAKGVVEEKIVETVEEAITQAPAELKPLSEGEPVVWKMRTGATLALVLTESEFKNKLITGSLKQIVVDAGINPKEIGFGVLNESAEEWDFSEMPVPTAVVFRAIPVKKNPVVLSNGKVHISYPVAEVVMDTHKQSALLKLFKHLNQ